MIVQSRDLSGLVYDGRSVMNPTCCYCDLPIVDQQWIQRNGARTLTFHSSCAADFAVRLLCDVHEIENRDGLRLGLIGDGPADDIPDFP